MQGELEGAWKAVTGLDGERLTLAGRTDAGVHAQGQVASVRTRTDLDAGRLHGGLSACLPEDLKVLEVADVEPGFDARHSARWREYRYDVARTPVYVDTARMDEAARALVGEHDFSAYSSVGELGSRGSVRDVLALRVLRSPGVESAAMVRIVADAFLRQMVRRIVSALLLVGRGKIDVMEIVRGLELRDRSLLPGPAPAGNLTLVRVGYEEYTQ